MAFFWKISLPMPGFWYNNSGHKIVIRVMIKPIACRYTQPITNGKERNTKC
jgi:hypothetical protein